MNTKIDEHALAALNAVDAFNQYFDKGGYNYGTEEKQDARTWFVAGYASRHAQAEAGGGGPKHAYCYHCHDTGIQQHRPDVGQLCDCGRLPPPPTQPTASVPAAEGTVDVDKLQVKMNQAFYIDVCRSEDRVNALVEAGRKLLDSLPAHWHDEAVTDFADLLDDPGPAPDVAIPPSQPLPDEPVRGVPEGWQLVPIAITQEMALAAENATDGMRPVYTHSDDCHPNDIGQVRPHYFDVEEAAPAMWKAMLTAAPKPASEPDRVKEQQR